MQKNLRWRMLAIVGVVVLATWAVYPPGEKVRLGLDLGGGVQLVVRVETDEALRVESEANAQQLSEQLHGQGMGAASVFVTSPTELRVEGVPPHRDTEVRQLADQELASTYDRVSDAAGAHTFRMRPSVESDLRNQSVRQALQTIERRVNEFGVSEPVVAPYGVGGDRILVQLPGVADVARAKEVMGSPALLELRLVEAGPERSRETLLQARNGVVPRDMEVATGVGDVPIPGSSEAVYYLVRRVPVVTGRDLRNARPSLDENNQPAVSFSLNREGGRRFGAVTSQNIGRRLAIVLDGRVHSAPFIEGRVATEGQIAGGFSQDEASDLALVLRSGALPAPLTYLEQRRLSPSLGTDSIRAGLMASIAGLMVISLFMLAYYRLAGINAVLAVCLNLLILLSCLVYVGAALTLPGIAGVVLTIGIGVDSNVLIFERIKEEVRLGKGARAAVRVGFDRVFFTILDTHIASLIAAAFLFQFGSGPIRGFATTLFFGLISNVFTAVFVSRTLFEWVLRRRPDAPLSI